MAEETLEELPDDNDIEQQTEEAGALARVNPLDPDFLLMFLFAAGVDSLDAFFELSGIGKPFGIVFDIFTFIIIVGWMNWRMGKITETKKARQAALQRALQQQIKKLEQLKKIGGVSDKVFDRYMRRYGERMGKAGRSIARLARKPLARALIRGALIFLGELFWFIGLIPFWTIGVILMVREK